MIGYLKGKIVKKDAESLILDVNGVGYHLNIPENTLSEITEGEEDTEFFVHTHVREDSISLYGFTTEMDKAVFQALIGVSGIGPRLGLATLASLKTNEILKAIASNNSTLLSSIPGIGKKTAERIILELKDKIGKKFPGELERIKTGRVSTPTFKDDLMSALLNLGYKKNVAERAIARIEYSKHGSLELALKESLKLLSKQSTM